MNYWSEKVVLITGASDGFGAVLADTFARHGARLVLAARRREPLEAKAHALRAAGCETLAVPADVTRDADAAELVAQAVEHFGRLDALVNNAGRSARGEVLDTSAQMFREMLELNFLSVVRLTQQAAPHLLAARGHVINIGSLASKAAARYLGAYPASKHALAAYSQQLRLELGPRGLHVLLVCPGPIRRDQPRRAAEDADPRLPQAARRPGGGVKTRLLDPQHLAEEILWAAQRRRAELVRPRRARLLFALAQLSPPLGDWLVRKLT